MQKIKIFFSLILLVILIGIVIPVYADDETDEASITAEEIEEILETSTELDDVPTINARNAVVYDRTSRGSTIWQGRRYKM